MKKYIITVVVESPVDLNRFTLTQMVHNQLSTPHDGSVCKEMQALQDSSVSVQVTVHDKT